MIRNNSAFLVKRNGVQFSAEKGNLTNKNSARWSGLVNKRAVDVRPGLKGAVVISVKSSKASAARRPASLYNSVSTKADFRRVARIISVATERSHYRPDVAKAALARWTKIANVLRRKKTPKRRGPRRVRN